MTMLAEDRWAELVRAEIATADGPASEERYCRVAAAYEAAGLPDLALAVLSRADKFGVGHRAGLLPNLLRLLRSRGQFTELNRLAQEGLAIADRDAALQRELAQALACLSQIPAAEHEWARLIRSGHMTDADWLGCSRFVLDCADAASLGQLMTAFGEGQELGAHPLAAFCTLKHLMARGELAAARHSLTGIDPARAGFGDPHLLLELAILGWRLGDYAKAETAATLASASGCDPSIARRILATIHSFAGDFSRLRTVALPRAREAGKIVPKLALTCKQDSTAWGFLYQSGTGSLAARMLNLTTEPDMVIPENFEPVVTFSLLSASLSSDPWPILCGVDWSWPHILLRPTPGGSAVHFFVEAVPGHKDWLWEEVNPETGGADRQPSAVWAAAMRELDDLTNDEP